jgi:oligosaccharide translocation protein RFT1
MQSTQDVLRGAMRGAKYNMVLQVLFRVVTFGVNAVILRYVSKATLGIANVRLMLLYTTALLLSREAVRKAALDLKPHYESGEHAPDVAQCRNLSWCSVPVGALVTAALAVVWTRVLYTPELVAADGGDDHASSSSAADRYNAGFYAPCVGLYAASVMLELLCDSLYIRCQNEMRQRVCVVIEGVAIMARAAVTVLLAISRPDLGILAFGLGQLAFSGVLCAAYFAYFTVQRGVAFADLLPGRVAVAEAGERQQQQQQVRQQLDLLLPPGSVPLTVSLFTQSVLKQFLTEGERLLMTVVANVNFEDQGVCVGTIGSGLACIVCE